MSLMYIGCREPIAEDAFSMKNLTTYGKYGQVENGKYVCIIKWCSSNEPKIVYAARAGGCAVHKITENKREIVKARKELPQKLSPRSKTTKQKKKKNRKIIIYIYILFSVYVRLKL